MDGEQKFNRETEVRESVSSELQEKISAGVLEVDKALDRRPIDTMKTPDGVYREMIDVQKYVYCSFGKVFNSYYQGDVPEEIKDIRKFEQAHREIVERYDNITELGDKIQKINHDLVEAYLKLVLEILESEKSKGSKEAETILEKLYTPFKIPKLNIREFYGGLWSLGEEDTTKTAEDILKENLSSSLPLYHYNWTKEGDLFTDRGFAETTFPLVIYKLLQTKDPRDIELDVLEIAAGSTPVSLYLLGDNSHATYVDPLYKKRGDTEKETVIPGKVQELDNLVGQHYYDLIIGKRFFGAPVYMEQEKELGRQPTNQEQTERIAEHLNKMIIHLKNGGLIVILNHERSFMPDKKFFEERGCVSIEFDTGGVENYWVIRKL